MGFENLGLIAPLQKSVAALGYTAPTPIQEQAIPLVLSGRDLFGCAQTGTGKTAAFALPILQRLFGTTPVPGRTRRVIRALILAPTRELAAQINQSFHDYGAGSGLRSLVIFGGVGQNPQTTALAQGVDILVATPGRLLDLMNQGFVKLGQVEVLVLDEADRMLDMGFIHDIRKVVEKLPKERQTLFFSATLPNEIKSLADKLLTDPASVSITPPASTVELIEQSVRFVEREEKFESLLRLLEHPNVTRALVFTRTTHGADKVVRLLSRSSIAALAIHGRKSQNNREAALASFKNGRTRVLVATDIASRGLDIDEVSHVVNYDLPNEPEAYVHRIGRTGRAGATGAAVMFCSPDELPLLSDIERTIRLRIPLAPGSEERRGEPGAVAQPKKVRPAETLRRPRIERPEAARSTNPRPQTPAKDERRESAPRQEPRRNPRREEGPRREGQERRPAPREGAAPTGANAEGRRREGQGGENREPRMRRRRGGGRARGPRLAS